MFEAGLGGALISDVNTGIPQGSIDMRMMSGWISGPYSLYFQHR